jgi:thiol-disulfide isomerase/thioredoxin
MKPRTSPLTWLTDCCAAQPLALALGLATLPGPAAAALKPGQPWPAFDQFQLEGKLPDKLRGQVLLVDFWASWCPPCKASFAALEALHSQLAGEGLVIIAVNVDEQRAAMEAFLKQRPVSFCVVRDAAQKLVAKADIAGLPASFLIDRAGKVRFVHTGFHGESTRKQYQEEIKRLLREPIP